jgi:periplasmic protein TonB
MSAVLPYQPGTGDAPAASWQRAKRFATFAPIVLLHVGLFHALQSGMAQRVVKLPTAVFATLIQPETSRPAPPPAPLKSLSSPKLTMPTIAPVIVPDIAAPNTAVATMPAKESATIVPSTPTQTAITAPSQPKTISSVEYLQAPQPEYPSMSRRMGEQGKVLLRILVNEKGRAEHIDIQRSSGFPRLDDAARAAASRALFKPYVEDGKAMPVYVVVPIGFQLD